MSIQLTQAAIQEVKRMIQSEKEPEQLGLRLMVKGGGCSGLSYAMNFDQQKEKDNLFLSVDQNSWRRKDPNIRHEF